MGTVTLRGQEGFFEFIPGWRAFQVIESEPGNYLTNGMISDLVPLYHYVINAVDENGTSTIHFEYDNDSIRTIGSERNQSMEFIDGSFYTLGTMQSDGLNYYAYLLEFSTDLDEVLDVHVLNECCEVGAGFTLHASSDDHLMATAFYEIDSPFYYTYFRLSKLDLQAQELWHQDFYCTPGVFNCNIRPIHTLETPDGGFLLTSTVVINQGGDPCYTEINSLLIRTDAQGNELWRREVGDENYWNYPGWPVLLDNGNVLFFWTDAQLITSTCYTLNPLWTVRFAEIELETGNILWQGDLLDELPTLAEDPLGPHGYYITKVQMLDDGNILATGYNGNSAMLLKLNPLGDLIWKRFYLPEGGAVQAETTAMDTWLFGVEPTSDGGFVGVGEFRADPFGVTWPEGYQSAFILKLDQYGCLEPGCQLLDALPEYSRWNLEVWPNPYTPGSSAPLGVRLPKGLQVDHVMLVDAMGRVIEDSRFKVLTAITLNLKS